MVKKTTSPLANKIRSTISREEEIEYGMKELVQGLLIGFIIGFLIALVFGSVSMLIITICVILIGIFVTYYYELKTGKGYRGISRMEEIEYGIMELFQGLLIGVMLGFLIAMMYTSSIVF